MGWVGGAVLLRGSFRQDVCLNGLRSRQGRLARSLPRTCCCAPTPVVSVGWRHEFAASWRASRVMLCVPTYIAVPSTRFVVQGRSRGHRLAMGRMPFRARLAGRDRDGMREIEAKVIPPHVPVGHPSTHSGDGMAGRRHECALATAVAPWTPHPHRPAEARSRNRSGPLRSRTR